MNKLQILTAFLLVSLVLTIAATAVPTKAQGSKYGYPLIVTQAEGSNSASIGEGCFSVFHISDTQTLTMATSRTYLFDQQCQWIVDNSAYFNNKMVIHTGDIQDNGNIADQWISANNSMSLLMNNSIPYAWCAGNHDLYPVHIANSPWLGGDYAAFDPTSFIARSYWVSNFSEGKNTATKFSYTNNGQIYNFLVAMVEFDANNTVLTWMADLINRYPDYNVIVGTHDYMNTNGEYTSYGANLSSVLDTLPNVVMVLCGHMHNSSDPSQIAHKTVNGREEIEWDLQEYDASGIGSADVQILTFNLTGAMPTVYVSTFQTYMPTQYLTSTGHTYNFTLTLKSEPKPTPTPIIIQSPLPSPSPTGTPLTSNSPSPSPSGISGTPVPENFSGSVVMVVAIIFVALLLAFRIVRVRGKKPLTAKELKET